MLHRLSRAVAAVRVWFSGKRDAEARIKQALAECRSLKKEIRDLQYQLDAREETHRDNISDRDGTLNSTQRELANANETIRNQQWQLRENESTIALKDREIEDLSLMLARHRTKVEQLIAMDQATIVRANHQERRGPYEGDI